MVSKVLVVDDEKLIRWSIRERLQREKYAVFEAPDVAGASELLETQTFDVALLDLKLPDGSGLDLLRKGQEVQSGLMAIIITAHSSVETAVEAIREGAYDYVAKPFNVEDLLLTVRRALDTRSMRHTLNAELSQKKREYGFDAMVGQSPAFVQACEAARKVARSDSSTVLLLGETGSGKDAMARAIHYESARASRPFTNITCTAMPEQLIESELFGHEKGAFTSAAERKEGLFELANEGTVFLDEVGDMPPALQGKLLRVLEEKAFRRIGGTRDITVDCRIIAATNRDLAARMREGTFREDLYYRLSTIPLVLPPLRERAEDIPVLATHFLGVFDRKLGRTHAGFTGQALKKLAAYGWPGNIREMRNVVERAVLLGGGRELDAQDLVLGEPGRGNSPGERAPFLLPPEGCVLAEVERQLIEQALNRTQGNQTRAAELLGLSRDQIRYKIDKHGLGESS